MKICKVSGYDLTPSTEKQWIDFVKDLSEKFQKGKGKSVENWKKDEYLKFKKESPLFNYSEFITPMWQRHYDHIEKIMLENSSQLLRDELVQYAMALSVGAVYQRRQIPYLKSRWDEKQLSHLLAEDPYFAPYITHLDYQTSETLVNHLTHLTFFAEQLKLDLKTLSSVVEFGGGYGSMARLLRRIQPKMTHITIDLPIFCFIQEAFLRSVFGEGSVKLLLSENDAIEAGKINLLPIGNSPALDKVTAAHPDLFIATWSLSEANHFTQSEIFNRKYFGAKFLLMGYRYYADKINPEQPASNSLTPTSNYSIVMNGKTFFAPDQHYLFARREGI